MTSREVEMPLVSQSSNIQLYNLLDIYERSKNYFVLIIIKRSMKQITWIKNIEFVNFPTLANHQLPCKIMYKTSTSSETNHILCILSKTTNTQLIEMKLGNEQ